MIVEAGSTFVVLGNCPVEVYGKLQVAVPNVTMVLD